MMSSISSFSYLPCPYGKQCDRPYCTYFHDLSSPIQSQNSELDNNRSMITNVGGETPYQALMRTPKNDLPAPTLNKQKSRNQLAPKEKPVFRVDLANDSILLGASHISTVTTSTTNAAGSKKQVKRPMPVKRKQDPIPSVTTFRIPTKLQRQTIQVTPPQVKVKKRKNVSISSKMTAATNGFIAELNEEQLNAKVNKSGYQTTKFYTLDDKKSREFTIRSPHLTPDNSPLLATKKSAKELDDEKAEQNVLITKQVKILDEIQILKAPQTEKTGIEQEAMEIELLERKMRLLKEYKQLAQEVAEIESKKAVYSNEKNAVDSKIDDETGPNTQSSSIEPPTKTRRLNVDTPIENVESSKQRDAVKVSKPFVSSNIKDSLAQAVKVKNVAKSDFHKVPTSTAATRNMFHKQMMDRVPQTTTFTSGTTKWTLNNGPKATSQTPTKSRVAHSSENSAPLLVLIDRNATKIPFNQRHRSLAKLHEEICLHKEVDAEKAVEMARQTEKSVFDKSETSMGYSVALAGAVRAVRNMEFSLPSSSAGDQKGS